MMSSGSSARGRSYTSSDSANHDNQHTVASAVIIKQLNKDKGTPLTDRKVLAITHKKENEKLYSYNKMQNFYKKKD